MLGSTAKPGALLLGMPHHLSLATSNSQHVLSHTGDVEEEEEVLSFAPSTPDCLSSNLDPATHVVRQLLLSGILMHQSVQGRLEIVPDRNKALLIMIGP